MPFRCQATCPTMMSTLIRRSKVASFCFLTLLFAFSASATCLTERCKGFQSDLDFFVQKGIENYCYWEEKIKDTGHDFKAIAASLKAQITDATTMTEFNTIMRTWASAFHDGHVNFMITAQGDPIQLATGDVRFELLAPGTSDETLIIAKASPSLGLQTGDVVTQIGKHRFSEAIDLAVNTQSGSTLRMRRYFAAKRLLEVIALLDGGTSVSITVHDAQSSGSLKTIAVPITYVPYPGNSGVSPVFDPAVRSLILDHNIGYLRINRFMDSEAGIIQAMEALAGTDALIIDVRDNGGGDQSGDEVLKRLIEKEITRYSVSARASADVLNERPDVGQIPLIPGTDFTQWTARLVSPEVSHSYTNKKVVTLINAGCFSATDTFASALRANCLSTLMGIGTGGGTGTPLVQRLPYTQHAFRYSVVRGKSADEQPIEGKGTLPDVVSIPTAAERALGIDATLMLAVEHLLRDQKDQPTAGTASPLFGLKIEGLGSLVNKTPLHAPIETQSLEIHPLAHEQMQLLLSCGDILHRHD